MKYQTLMRDLPIHQKFSLDRKISADHEKFLELGRQGSILISSLPGWSTHVEQDLDSPCFEWERQLQNSPP
jgi:hypothetical protein